MQEPATRLRLRSTQTRDVAFCVDLDGVVSWCDEGAAAALHLTAGVRLADHLSPVGEERLRPLLARACASDADDEWTLPFVVDGHVVVVVLDAARDGGHIELCGQVTRSTYAQAFNENVRHRRELDFQRDELKESHLAVVALHGELADKENAAEHAAEVKARLVANISHEFRTPLHSILGLSKLLLDECDGPLNEEQSLQLRFIRQGAEELSTLVDDLLDLSKLDAGKAALHIERFSVQEFLTGLRGAMRPLLARDAPVKLVVDDLEGDVTVETDRGKLAQILRNLIGNAIKFTEEGEVRVSVVVVGDSVAFAVADTGVGIAPADQESIFEEFTQLKNRLQAKTKGAGLGLSLSRRLAQLLGGSIVVDSAVDHGATFTLHVPMVHEEAVALSAIQLRPLDPQKAPILVVEDDRKSIFVYERFLTIAGFQIVPARTIEAAREVLQRCTPAAILLDVMLEGEASWDFLAELKQAPATKNIPVLVVTVTNREQKARALGADEFWLKPLDEDRLLKKLKQIARSSGGGPRGIAKVLHIDDDPAARYLFRKILAPTPYTLLETSDGHEGIAIARREKPHVIVLDFLLKEMTAFDVLDDLKSDPRTRDIPVIISTSHALPAEERERLAQHTDAILSKAQLSRELALHRITDALRKAGVGNVTTEVP